MTEACASSTGAQRSGPTGRRRRGESRSFHRFCQVAGAVAASAARRVIRVSAAKVVRLCRLASLAMQLYMHDVIRNHRAWRGSTRQLEPALGADLLAVVARLNRLATQRIQMPLPAAQARLLATIEAHGEARIGDLAAVDHCSQPTMTTQVRRLEDAGLVTRTVDPGDARAVRIRITADGRRTLNAVRADRAAAIAPQLAQLGPEDRAGARRRGRGVAPPCRQRRRQPAAAR